MVLSQTQNRNLHRPHHIYGGHTYFLTARCWEGKKYFEKEYKKILWQNVFRQSIERFSIRMYAWVLLDNHYHILFSLPQSINKKYMPTGTDFAVAQSVIPIRRENISYKEWNDEMSAANFVPKQEKHVLTEFVRKLHKDSSRELNKLDQTPGRKIWYQYHDYCIRNITDFWKHFNYILKNPFKHRLVASLQNSFMYKYSSNPTWLERFGNDGIHEGFCKYPVQEVFEP